MGPGGAVPARVIGRARRRVASLLLAAATVLASCTPETLPPTAPLYGQPVRPEGAQTPPAVTDHAGAVALLEQAEAAMKALDSFEQHVYATAPLDWAGDERTGLWELWDTEYRHERPDRLRIVVRTAWVGQGSVFRRPNIGIHIGEHAWTRDLPSTRDAPWSCSSGGVTEMPHFSFAGAQGEAAEYLGLERIGAGAAHVVSVKRPTIEEAREGASGVAISSPDATAGSWPDRSAWTSPPTETRYWIDPETSLVLRMEVDHFEADRSATTEVREFGAFNTPREIYPPAPCATPTA